MKETFTPTNNDLSYYPLLYKALEATKGEIIEMGMGFGSSPILHEYILKYKRELFSYESNLEWFNKFTDMRTGWHSVGIVEDWNVVSKLHEFSSVVFIDHAPGERRKEDLMLFKPKAEIIVIHDTQPTGAGDYRIRPLFKNFKYCVEVMSKAPDPHTAGAWATAVSDKIDITKWVGEKFDDYMISEWQK
jgi:hypothetical protein